MELSPALDGQLLARRALRALFALTALGVVLLATHKGEFWPFSVYPMFSSAGSAWDRVLVRRVALPLPRDPWQDVGVAELPGVPVALEPLGVEQNALTELVKQTERWDTPRLEALRALLAPVAGDRPLMLFRIHGDIDETGRTTMRATPIVRLGARDASLNPALEPGEAALR